MGDSEGQGKPGGHSPRAAEVSLRPSERTQQQKSNRPHHPPVAQSRLLLGRALVTVKRAALLAPEFLS